MNTNKAIKEDCKNKHKIVITRKAEKKKQKNIIKITRKDCKNKQEINIKNYPIKKRI